MGAAMQEVGALEAREERFASFCRATEPGLRRALVAAFGPHRGSEAAADALAWAWEHFNRVEGLDNPGGYLWRVGRTFARRSAQQDHWAAPAELVANADPEAFEPKLMQALAVLPLRQRTAVLLVHGYGYSLTAAADHLGCRVRTLRHHLDRGMTKLRDQLGVTDARG